MLWEYVMEGLILIYFYIVIEFYRISMILQKNLMEISYGFVYLCKKEMFKIVLNAGTQKYRKKPCLEKIR
jgi:hypothetical protein